MTTGADLAVLTRDRFESAYKIFNERVQRDQLMCRIYDCFTEPGSVDHNCLGCNLDDMTELICNFLEVCGHSHSPFSPEQGFAIYVLLLNMAWERTRDVLSIVSLPEPYLVQHFAEFIKARRWANFFKHPKHFGWMVHHPVYTFEGSHDSEAFLSASEWLKIDDDFVKKYYASEGTKGLYAALHGRENRVVVILPDPEVLTQGVCTSLEKFIEIVTENPVYREILEEKSTFTDYFAELEKLPDQSEQ